MFLSIAFVLRGALSLLSRDRSPRACELGELGLEVRDDGEVLVVLGEAKGSCSIGRNEARISSGS